MLGHVTRLCSLAYDKLRKAVFVGNEKGVLRVFFEKKLGGQRFFLSTKKGGEEFYTEKIRGR